MTADTHATSSVSLAAAGETDDRELTADERAELDWLRRQNKLLRVERDMLLKIAKSYSLDEFLDR